MKKIILVAGAVAMAFSFTACQQDGGDQAAKDWAAIDSMANTKSAELMASMNAECMTAATAKGLSMVDSVMKTMKKGGSGTAKTTTTTTTVVTPPAPTGVNNRPGTTTQSNPKVDSRPGTTNNADNKPKVNNRPGANTPPK